jgi:hypothetical protein
MAAVPSPWRGRAFPSVSPGRITDAIDGAHTPRTPCSTSVRHPGSRNHWIVVPPIAVRVSYRVSSSVPACAWYRSEGSGRRCRDLPIALPITIVVGDDSPSRVSQPSDVCLRASRCALACGVFHVRRESSCGCLAVQDHRSRVLTFSRRIGWSCPVALAIRGARGQRARRRPPVQSRRTGRDPIRRLITTRAMHVATTSNGVFIQAGLRRTWQWTPGRDRGSDHDRQNAWE